MYGYDLCPFFMSFMFLLFIGLAHDVPAQFQYFTGACELVFIF